MSSALEELSDEDLLGRFNQGEARAFEVLLSRYERPIYNFILRSVRERDRATDLVQDVFLKVVQRADQFKGDSKFSTWLYTIARNCCIDHSRKMVFRRHRSLDAPVREDEGGTMLDRVEGKSLAADRGATAQRLQSEIADAVESLPDDQKEVFLMRQVQGLPFKEIAKVVGVPENTVKSRMRYALERLQQALQEYQDYAKELS